MENPTKTIRFRSYSARVIDSVFVNDTLIYLTIAGQEDGIKAMTALMMQGRVYQDEHWINLNGRLGFQINKAGNRRLLEPIGEGYAHCAFFHESVLPSNGMRVLLANDEAEAFVRFQQFLESACPLPRLVSLAADSRLEREAFDSLKQTSVIAKADVMAGSKIAYSIDTAKLFKDDYLLLRETMIDIVDRFYSERDSLGIVSRREVIKAATEQKTQKAKAKPAFYRSFLKNAPKIKATEKERYKKIVAKWFSPSMTWYAVEYDPDNGELFGYVENIGYQDDSEWGYFSIQELEGFPNQYPRYYVERDLHLDDCWIDFEGRLYHENPLEAKVA